MYLGGVKKENESFNDLAKDIFNDQDFLIISKKIKELGKKYDIKPKKIFQLTQTEEHFIPLNAFSDKNLSSFEIIVKYLHEEKELNFAKISNITNRDQKTIWCTYNNAKKKSKTKITHEKSVLIPVSIIYNRTFSVLESITAYLKEESDMTLSQIATRLSLDQRTIWTCYNRYKNKRMKNEE